jgi:hypothetical protein
MPPRPAFQVKRERPGSAIYLGKNASFSPNLQDLTQSSSAYPSLIDGTPPSLPDLPEPEPPSPSSSVGSAKSGLPSPPATNSTGSGSTGDPATIAVRARPVSLHSNNSSASTSSGGHHTTVMSGSSSSREDEGILTMIMIMRMMIMTTMAATTPRDWTGDCWIDRVRRYRECGVWRNETDWYVFLLFNY